MERSVVYECPVCSAASSALVSGLYDPAKLSDEDKERFLDSSAKDALLHATCPRCGERNPAGVLERAKDRRLTRIVGSLVSSALAVGIWFVPGLALVVATIVVAMTALVVASAWRADALRVRALPIAGNVAFTLLFIAAAWFYPRAAALLPLVLAARFAIYATDMAPWERAKDTIRFEQPYR